jgi:hypothetical protein
MKGETRKIYRPLIAFYQTIIILMVRWSFETVGFLLDLDNVRNPVQIDPGRGWIEFRFPTSISMTISSIMIKWQRKIQPGIPRAKTNQSTNQTNLPSVWRLTSRQWPGRVHCVATVKKRKSAMKRKAISIKPIRFSSLFD